jgi:hypothetical protein
MIEYAAGTATRQRVLNRLADAAWTSGVMDARPVARRRRAARPAGRRRREALEEAATVGSVARDFNDLLLVLPRHVAVMEADPRAATSGDACSTAQVASASFWRSRG